MKAQHTSGPWRLNGTAVESEDQYIASVDDETHDDGEANVRLIAAAPRLLEALQKIVTYCECAPPRGDQRMQYELFHEAKAAIAAATGER